MSKEKDKINMSKEKELLEIYKLHSELGEGAASKREDLNKLYSSIIISTIAASVIIFKLTNQIPMPNVLLSLGIIVSISWSLSLYSMTNRISAKYETLQEMEKNISFPFSFVSEENKKIKSHWLTRRRNTVQIMPAIFLLFCLFLLIYYNFKSICSLIVCFE